MYKIKLMIKRWSDADMPKGFLFSVAEAAIKKPGRKDIALICSEVEANTAGTFTTNMVKAAPVKLDIRKIKTGKGRAIIVNSGNANACTGARGMRDAVETASLAAKNLGISPSLVYVCSTGVIGTPMPMDRIRPGISELTANLGKATLNSVASAIMTTDTFPKIAKRKIKIDNRTGIITGICKGAGMICPDMATMLCFILTDIAVDKKTLNKALKNSVENSFNRITIDGDMSTNDTALIMANGMLGNSKITEKSFYYKTFKKALDEITYELSRLIVIDGEGATKLVEIVIRGAVDENMAKKAACAVANSNLVKTAIFGNDSNWGRIMAAIGRSGIKLNERRIDIHFGAIKLVSKGIGTGKDHDANIYLKNNTEIEITADLHSGKASSKVLTCDLTENYVRVNAEYRT